MSEGGTEGERRDESEKLTELPEMKTNLKSGERGAKAVAAAAWR